MPPLSPDCRLWIAAPQIAPQVAILRRTQMSPDHRCAAVPGPLAVDGNVLADFPAELFEPLLDASDEPGRIEQSEHAAKRII